MRRSWILSPSALGPWGMIVSFVALLLSSNCLSAYDGTAVLEAYDSDERKWATTFDLEAGSLVKLRVKYTAGTSRPGHLLLRLATGGTSGLLGFQTDKDKPNYLNAVNETDGQDLGVSWKIAPRYYEIRVTLTGGSVGKGDEVMVYFGGDMSEEEREKGWRVPNNAGASQDKKEEIKGKGRYFALNVFAFHVYERDTEMEESPLGFTVKGAEPDIVLISPRSNAVKDVGISVVITVLGRFGNLATDSGGNGWKLTLTCPTDEDATIGGLEFGGDGRDVVIDPADAGSMRRTVVFTQEGLHRIYADPDFAKTKWTSCAILSTTTEDEPDRKLLWGDLHVHTNYSDGFRTIHNMFDFARDVSGFDFLAPADHSYGPAHLKALDAQYTEEIDGAKEEGLFTTIKGFEWNTSNPQAVGHHNVYYRTCEGYNEKEGFNRDLVLSSRNPAPTRFWTTFLDRVEDPKRNGLIIPHHVAEKPGTGFVKNWSSKYHSVRQERLVEIYSAHGLCEYQGNPRPPLKGDRQADQAVGHNVQDALALGYKLGFVAASDSHTTRPGLRGQEKNNGHRPGITAVYAEGETYEDANTRRSVWDALWERRCYATTGVRIYIDFSINNEPMGSEIPLDDEDEIALHARVIGLGEIDRVEVVRGWIEDGKVPNDPNTASEFGYYGQNDFKEDEYQITPDATEVSIHWVHTQDPQHPDCFYYIRVIQKDEEMAWSSPIWVSPSMKENKITKITEDASGNVSVRFTGLPYRRYAVYYKDNVNRDWTLAEQDFVPDSFRTYENGTYSPTVVWIDDGVHTSPDPDNENVTKRWYKIVRPDDGPPSGI